MLHTRVCTGTRWDGVLQSLDDHRFLIPRSYKKEMNVDALIFSNADLIKHICQDLSLEQAVNVATLPGIVGKSLVMPDAHQGYGFPIGGVAAMDMEHGIISPGGVGFDINCGVRLLTSELTVGQVRPVTARLIDALYEAVPAGTGSEGAIELSDLELDRVLGHGARWCLQHHFASDDDLLHTEECGCMIDADPRLVSVRAKKRGVGQLGTLGSGNHFLEVQFVDEIFDATIADQFKLFSGQVCIMIHCGSRGLGHQVCTDYVSAMSPVMARYGIKVLDRQLACCPIQSEEGQRYLGAMAAAANFAFANRQVISHLVRRVMDGQFGEHGKLKLLYDVAHNMAKVEHHSSSLDGGERQLLVHRKGATRAFAPDRKEIGALFQLTGQPVIIPGDMGRASYVLVGTERAMRETFGSVCHGAGRLMSRTKARLGRSAAAVKGELLKAGIVARATTREGLTEEVSEAYKPIEEVVEVVERAGLALRVARLRPLGVVKG